MAVSTKVLLQPGGEPLTVAEAKLACRIDADITADDDYIADLITKARVYCEDVLAQALISQTMLFTFDQFPRGSQAGGLQYQSEGLWDQRLPVTELSARAWPDRACFRLPRSPLQGGVVIQYTDQASALQTLAATGYRIDYISDPPRIAPAYGTSWPLAVMQTQVVNIRAVMGHGPATSIAGSITAGERTVTPASMYGIYAQNLATDPLYPGTTLSIDKGQNRELVTVTAVTATTFTATFAKNHSAGALVRGAIPETTRGRMLMLIAHWFRNREPVTLGQYSTLPLAEEALHYAAWNGECR